MNINYGKIDEYVNQLGEEIDDLSIELDHLHNDMVNAEMIYKEVQLKFEDSKKIKEIENASNDTNAVFSPHSKHEFINEEQSDIDLEMLTNELNEAKNRYEMAEKLFDSVSNRVREKVDTINYLEVIKKDIKNQIAEITNEAFITELKEVTQKKRLIILDKTKYASVITKTDSTCIKPMRDSLKEMMTGINFIEADPVRAKQNLTNSHKEIEDIVNKTETMLYRFNPNIQDKPILEALNEYIGEMTHIYSDIIFKITVSNLKQVDMIDGDMNRCLMAFFKGMINSFILKCKPTEINLRYVYDDGFLMITGIVKGNYINFYQEITDAPTSVVSNMYEKVFLLNGSINFTNLKDGSFKVFSKIPVKNYL